MPSQRPLIIQARGGRIDRNFFLPAQSHCKSKLFHEQTDCQRNSLFAIILATATLKVSPNFIYMGKREETNRTANPQIGIRPTKQCCAPSAIALNISEPRRMPPSIAMGIRPAATGLHSRSASRVAGTPSSCRPPWLEIMIPSRP